MVCGPTDGAWVWVTVELADAVHVFAQAWFDGEPYGRSVDVALSAGVSSSFGFSPDTPTISYGRTLSLKISLSDFPDKVVAVSKVKLQPTGNGMCG